jgi:hypothetical protein
MPESKENTHTRQCCHAITQVKFLNRHGRFSQPVLSLVEGWQSPAMQEIFFYEKEHLVIIAFKMNIFRF